MTSNSIDLHVAEHALMNAIETLIASPAKLGTTEATAALKLRIVVQVLSLSEERTNTVSDSVNAIEA